MLRFVQGINKVFRSNQAYAPCQKAAHDSEEFETCVGDSPVQQRRSYCEVTSVPLSRPLPASSYGFHDADRSSQSAEQYQNAHSSQNNTESHFTRSVPSHGLVSGALLGAGCAALKTVHAYCSGRGNARNKARSKYCPVAQQSSSGVLLRAITNVAIDLLPIQRSRFRKGLSIVPQSTAGLPRSSGLGAVEDSVDKDGSRQAECKKAQDAVNAIAEKLGDIDKENLAVDHFLALRAWDSHDFVFAAGLWQRTVDKFATPVAAHRLGVMYECGHGVPIDYEQASAYYTQAIEHQCRRAMYRQAMLQMNGLVEGSTRSLDLMKESARLNYAKAQTFLGTMHFHEGKKALAVEYYRKAAAQDDVEACFYLGICYETGEGLHSPDMYRAAEFYMKAAKGGQSDAQFNIAMFLEEGCGGLGIDGEKALYWLNESAKQGNKRAKERLREIEADRLPPSASLPSISMHLPHTLSDLAVPGMHRGYSDTVLSSKRTPKAVAPPPSHASSASSLAGRPQFYIPSEESELSLGDSLTNWSDEGLSSASSSSLRLERQDDNFSIEFIPEKTSLSSVYPLRKVHEIPLNLSNSSLYRPQLGEPEIIFA